MVVISFIFVAASLHPSRMFLGLRLSDGEEFPAHVPNRMMMMTVTMIPVPPEGVVVFMAFE